MYNGYLIKVGGSSGTALPMQYIKLEGYDITPNQRMESEAKRAVTGILHRTTVDHTATKIEFTTPCLTDMDVHALNGLLGEAWTSVSERKLELEYYDMETATYKTGTFYMPGTIELNLYNKEIYAPSRVAFIEY